MAAPGTEAVEVASFLMKQGLASDARLLDVPCGLGYRALLLAKHGFRVTGSDSNRVAIDAARARAPTELSERLRFRVAPRESLPGLFPSDTFDAILCLDHALCHGPPSEDVALLRRLRSHLAPGGLLLVDLLHMDFFAVRPRPFAYHVIGEIEQHEFRSFDPLSGVLDLTWKFYQRDGEDLRHRGNSSVRLRLLVPQEARQLLEEAGWRVEAIYGGWNNETVTPDRRKLVLVARAAARH